MRKLSLFTLVLPALALVMSSCNNTKSVSYISAEDAIAFAKEHYDPHIQDGYNVSYVFNSKDSKITDGAVYKKHYYDPTKREGEYYLEKAYDVNLNLQNIVSTLYYKKTLSFGSEDLAIFHQTMIDICSITGYVDFGFTKDGDHLGYYISSTHLDVIAGVLSELLEIASYIFVDSTIVVILAQALKSFTAEDAMCTADIQFTRFGFLDTVDLIFTMNKGEFDFSKMLEFLPDTFYGDYMSLGVTNINFSLTCNYSL